ncbi:helix-turn-helix domain-containing protein [Streptomyces sp. NPDC047000]|uniref:helix-turn-helix domain-containing protein n=1 Tax=Streptomyces sp. NPDC047000 TaxID=3155474 RepID=UPI00340F78D5
MDTQDTSVPPRARSRRIAGKPAHRHPEGRVGGLVHDNRHHSARFTVIGNHLAQHAELSGLAIGLGVHIQSLPAGAQVDIKTLTARFPEGSARIAAALRELEIHGYLRRDRERLSGGRIVTRTTSCNQPGAARNEDEPACAAPERSAVRPKPKTKPETARKALPAVPQPAAPSPALIQKATDLLTDLRDYNSRMVLSACDTAHLAPGAAAWLERGVAPSALRHALLSDLPLDGVRRPAAFLAYRLADGLPSPSPWGSPTPDTGTPQPPALRHKLVNCDGCDHAFRAAEPGLCGGCREAEAAGSGTA